uniref:hypothetical protein n=1 Tax=Parerythrobacter lutipelagi TaxID=1964208 RepID=UPI0010F99794|nr:hypothetical protein [Parerythrobacter lutipelagi]
MNLLQLTTASLVGILPLVPVGATAQDRATGLVDTSGRQQFEIVAAAAPACNVSPGAAASVENASFQDSGTSGGTVSITALADPETAEANPVSVQVEIPVVCNSAHDITVRSANGGLLRDGGTRAAMGGFVQFLPYAVRVDWVGQSQTGQSDELEALTMNVPNAGEGMLSVDIALGATGAVLVAGSYEDTLRIEITAAD